MRNNHAKLFETEEEEKLTGSGAETPRAVTKREHAPAARQRHQLLVEKGEHQPYLAMHCVAFMFSVFPSLGSGSLFSIELIERQY